MADLSESQTTHHLLRIRGHPEFPGEQILITRRHMDQGNSSDRGFCRGRSDRTVSTNHHQSTPTLKWLTQPCFGWPRTGLHQLDLDPLSGRHRRKRLGQSFRSPGAGDGIEDHQSRHDWGEYPPGIP